MSAPLSRAVRAGWFLAVPLALITCNPPDAPSRTTPETRSPAPDRQQPCEHARDRYYELDQIDGELAVNEAPPGQKQSTQELSDEIARETRSGFVAQCLELSETSFACVTGIDAHAAEYLAGSRAVLACENGSPDQRDSCRLAAYKARRQADDAYGHCTEVLRDLRTRIQLQRKQRNPRPDRFLAAPYGGAAAPPSIRIPGGSYTDRAGKVHQVATFAMDMTEVTVAAYRSCVGVGRCAVPETATEYDNYGKEDRYLHPVNAVSWTQARAFCTWRGGSRLPTAYEWEWAARGGSEGRAYPWGDDGPTQGHAVWAPKRAEGCGRTGTCPVGSRSPQGDSRDSLQDMAGNVAEWTDTAHHLARENRIQMGGDWMIADAGQLRANHRAYQPQGYADEGDGFRCARTVD